MPPTTSATRSGIAGHEKPYKAPSLDVANRNTKWRKMAERAIAAMTSSRENHVVLCELDSFTVPFKVASRYPSFLSPEPASGERLHAPIKSALKA